ncbi:hypothetical protein J4234_07255 [Candidatus Woesearchaeota archaeon]|nr:hypothetical protein [Candidatus Woesearchaeota archaeon]
MNKHVFKLFDSYPALILFPAVLIVFLTGCAGVTGKAVSQISKEINKEPEAYFCPREDCSKIFESQIKSANFSVYCAFYDLDLKNIITALSRKSKDIDVRLVMDSSNYEEQIKGDGIRMDDNEQLMHNKFCIIDSSVVITGSFNPTDNDNNYNNNNVVVIHSNTLAGNYEDEFNELWNNNFGKGSKASNPIIYINNVKIENFFCPEDDCASHIIDLIKNAESSVYFMSFSFTNEEIADAIIKKIGLDVMGILDSSQSSGKYSQFKRLREFGINVKKDTNKYKMHHKVFIIDNETVVTGSFNPTLSGDAKNDENLLIIHDKKIADAFLKEFDSLWA